jgi:hypothetical protein
MRNAPFACCLRRGITRTMADLTAALARADTA